MGESPMVAACVVTRYSNVELRALRDGRAPWLPSDLVKRKSKANSRNILEGHSSPRAHRATR